MIFHNIIGSDFLVDPGRSRHGGMAEDQMFDDLENMLGGVAGGKGSKATRVGGKNGLVRQRSNSRIVPHNDIDDLEDMNTYGKQHATPP